jgi:N-methylhydantoinase A
MEAECEAALAAQGFASDGTTHQRAIDCRYHGQEHTVRVPVDSPIESEEDFAVRFHQLHKQLYTFSLDQTSIELVNFRLTSTVETSMVPIASRSFFDAPALAPWRERTISFAVGNPASTPIYQRDALASGFRGIGPAIIEESSSTTVVLSGQTFEIDRYGNIVIAGDKPNRKEPSGAGLS